MTTEEALKRVEHMIYVCNTTKCPDLSRCPSCKATDDEIMNCSKIQAKHAMSLFMQIDSISSAIEKAERYKWHDVSENPPKPGEYIVKASVWDNTLCDGTYIWMYYGNGRWEFDQNLSVVKWKEIDRE